MSDLKQRMQEDRVLRDAAKALFAADMAHARNLLDRRSLSQRFLSRVGDGAKDVLEQAADTAGNHRATIGILLAAVALWFARHPLMALFDEKFGEDNDG